MKRMLWVALALVAGLGCEKKKAEPGAGSTGATAAGDAGPGEKAAAAAAPAPAEPPKPRYGDTTPLWALAPADATVGFVVADGAAARVLTTWAASVKKLHGKPFARKAMEQLQGLKTEAGFDILDESAYKAKGLDLAKGLAVFAPPALEMPSLFVLPVGDREAFRKTIEATVEKVGDREVDKAGNLVCTTAGTRYLCASSLEAIDAAVKPHDSPLAAAVKAMPADNRGDAEVFLDAAKTPKAKEALAETKPFGDFDTVGAALRVDASGMNFVGWGKGTMGPLAMMLASTPPPAELSGATANATSVFRLKFDPRLLAASGKPPVFPGPNGEQISLTDLLTGDLQFVTAGKGILAGAIQVKVTDPAKVKPLVAAICAEAKKGGSLPISAVVAKEDSCSGEVSLASLKEAIGVELPPFKFHFAVTGTVFTIVLGDLDPAALKGSVAEEASGPETKALLTGAQTAVVYSRNMDLDVTALPKDLAEKVNAVPEMADGLNLMNWSSSQVYDFGAGMSVAKDGFRLVFHATTFGGEPADARTALEAAFDKRASGDRAAYLAGLADVEKKFPGTLASRRAKLERIGTPIVGPILGVAVGAGAGYAYFMRMGGDAPSLGGFGQPGGGGQAPPAEEKAPAPEEKAPADKAPADKAPAAEDKAPPDKAPAK